MPDTKVKDYAPYGIIGGIVISGFIFFSGFYGAIFVYGPILPLMFIWPWLYRRLAEILGSMWKAMLVAIIEKLYRIRLVVTGDSIHRHEKTVILLNHRTRLDWFYFFTYVFHARILNRHKIALKSILKWFPGIGWAMQVAGYIFMDRNWETDQDHIHKILSYFIDLESKPNILFFPEGTDLTENTKTRSNKFASKFGLPNFDYVLHPRTKGFTFFVNTLRHVGGIQAVHDVTVAYPYNIPQGEKEIVCGVVPREVHFHIEHHNITELPEGEDELAEWVRERWVAKEQRLRDYYSQPDPARRRFPANHRPLQHPRNALLWLALVGWWLVIVVCSYLLYAYAPARFYAFMLCLFYLVSSVALGGAEKLEMMLYEMLFKSSDKWGRQHMTPAPPNDAKEGSGDASAEINPYDRFLRPPR